MALRLDLRRVEQIGIGLAAVLLLASAAWLWLPRFAPLWVIKHSPFLEPALRAASGRADGWGPYASRVIAGGTAAVPQLIWAFRNPDPRVRQCAAASFHLITDARALGPLAALLDDPDEGVAAAAALALGGSRDQRAIVPLRQHGHAPRDVLRHAVLSALTELGDTGAGPLFAAELHSRLQSGRQVALRGYTVVTDLSVVPELMAIAGGSALYESLLAVQALGFQGDSFALPLLRRMSHQQRCPDDPFDLPGAARQALGRIPGADRDRPAATP